MQEMENIKLICNCDWHGVY